MSDTYHRYRAIKQGLMQFFHPQPTGHCERHFNTLSAPICGLAGSQRAHLALTDRIMLGLCVAGLPGSMG
ncbi:MAG: hypothetical protein H0X37_13495 [Herpetosiphonaceae bacterium]|nr:hypothetical protein [Herpetosiphonaceae bacterium]